ncbi:MAG: hypothetical protein U0572_02215 [Phycisphaerales bacterium]
MRPTGPTQDVDFAPAVELLLFILGGVMTVGVSVIAVWLWRTMRREDASAIRGRREGSEGGEA